MLLAAIYIKFHVSMICKELFYVFNVLHLNSVVYQKPFNSSFLTWSVGFLMKSDETCRRIRNSGNLIGQKLKTLLAIKSIKIYESYTSNYSSDIYILVWYFKLTIIFGFCFNFS